MRFHRPLPLVLLCACSYPDSSEVFGGSDGSSSSASAGGSEGEGAGAAGGGPASTGAGPATAGSAGPATTASGAGGASCDADGDRAMAEDACGGDDCDDADADVHPGQTAYFTQPREGGSFDYDCNWTIDKEHPLVACSGAVCGANQGKVGFESDVVCGVEAQLGACDGIPCGFVPSGKATQGCR